jgi:hypothetical protein
MTFTCDYCNKEFSSKGVLKTHQKNTKYCLELRKEEFNNENKCNFCEKILTSKHKLKSHLEICPLKKFSDKNQELHLELKELKTQLEITKYELKTKEELYSFQIEELKSQNKELEAKLYTLASEAIQKETTVNHYKTSNQTTNIDKRTINMVPFDLTEEKILQKLQSSFTEKHLMRGQKGLAECVMKELLQTPDGKMLMKCTDPSRKQFITINKEGKLEKDINASNLTNILHQPAKKVCKEILDDMEERYHEIRNNISEELEEEDEEMKYLKLETDRLNYATTKAIEISSLNKNNSDFVNGILPVLSK